MTTRAQRSRGVPRRTVAAPATSPRLPLIIGGVLVAVVIVAAAAAIVLSGTPANSVAEPARVPVAVTGGALPALTDPANDPAVGMALPEISGVGLDGAALSITPGDGAMAIVVLAHWCSFCQTEVPILAGYLESGALPDGVQVVALATSIDPARPNYPPSRWLATEGWTVPTIVDDAASGGLAALGMSSFPGFVFVDGDGRVAYRATGAMGSAAFAQIVERLAP